MSDLLVDQMSYELEATHHDRLVITLEGPAELQARAGTTFRDPAGYRLLGGRQDTGYSSQRGGSTQEEGML